MTPPFLLIAEREFRAYVATLSFWVALAVGPLAVLMCVGFMRLAGGTDTPLVRVSVETPTPDAYRYAAVALNEAASLEGRRIVVLPRGDLTGAVRLELPGRADGRVDMAIIGHLPLSAAGRTLIIRTIERDGALAKLGLTVPEDSSLRPSSSSVPMPAERALGPAVARFVLVMMLWLTLTGSLGMLLQAVVRERANRALESLLAAARPADIVAGKVVGVGGVSLLVLAAWLAAGAALTPLASQSESLGIALAANLSNPTTLARAALVYVLAFAFYGMVTVAVGAAARDSAQAQNLSRPMFGVLLVAFFVALATVGSSTPNWLLFVPPFTPFMLLLASPDQLNAGSEALALCLLGASTIVAGVVAIRRIDLAPRVGRAIPPAS